MSEMKTDAELTMTIEGSAVGSVVNNLTTTVEGYALDARQGYLLDNKKLDKSKVANNLTTIEAGLALDARQGKWLNENKVGYGDIVNDLTTDDPSKVLSAAQGTVLAEAVAAAKLVLPLSVANGGTGSGVPAEARANIGAVSMKTATVSLSVSGWSSNQQTVSVSGVTEDNTIIVTAAPASYEHYHECAVRCTAQGNNTLTFVCEDKPSVALVANVVIFEGGQANDP